MRLTPRSSRWVITAVLFSVVGTSSAPAWSLDLMQAYQAALEQDPKIRAARAARDAAAERLPQARSQLLPNVSANVGRYDNNVDVTQQNALGRDVTSSDRYFSYNQTLQLRQPLFRKPLMDGLRQANSVVADAQATLDSELQDVGSRVAAAYLEALLAQDALELARKKKEVTTIQLDAARKSLAAGSGTRTDIDEALNPKKPVDTVLVNGCECEPYLTADHRLMLESPASIITGALLTARASGAQPIVCTAISFCRRAIRPLARARAKPCARPLASPAARSSSGCRCPLH